MKIIALLLNLAGSLLPGPACDEPLPGTLRCSPPSQTDTLQNNEPQSNFLFYVSVRLMRKVAWTTSLYINAKSPRALNHFLPGEDIFVGEEMVSGAWLRRLSPGCSVCMPPSPQAPEISPP